MSYDIKINNGDLALLNGDLKKAVDSEKLIQDILKLCLTAAGSNPMAPWYGSFLSRSIIGNPMDNSMIEDIAKSQINSALENFKTLQNLQVKSFQYVTADEQLGAILGIIVTRNSNDFRLFDITIKVITKGFKPITTAFKVSTI